MSEEEDQQDADRLAYYLEIGAVSLEGMDENGEMIYSISEDAETLAPELWQSHTEYVDRSLIELYEQGLVEVEYDENLEAILHISPEGQKIAREKAPEKSVEEAYKDLTINQKRQIINSKFDELLKELKIEKICPT